MMPIKILLAMLCAILVCVQTFAMDLNSENKVPRRANGSESKQNIFHKLAQNFSACTRDHLETLIRKHRGLGDLATLINKRDEHGTHTSSYSGYYR